MTTLPTKKPKLQPSNELHGKDNGFHIEETVGEGINPDDLEVAPIPTSKDKIEQPPLAAHEMMYIPPLGSSVVISGKSGSGKSTLLANLLKKPQFYGPSDTKPKGWFDEIFLFSPTANGDDVQKSLDIPKNHVFTDLEEAPELLEVILDTQQSKLDDSDGAHTVPQYAIIFDDVIGDTKFMNEKCFTRCFYQVRHVNCTTFICTQHFKRVPKVCRLQANFIFFFQGSQQEVEMVTEEFAPPEYSKNEFRRLVSEATRGRFNFLTINMKVGWDKRFRKNLKHFIKLDRFAEEDEEKKPQKHQQPQEPPPDDNKQEKNSVSNTKEADRVPKAIESLLKQHGHHKENFYGVQSRGIGGRADW